MHVIAHRRGHVAVREPDRQDDADGGQDAPSPVEKLLSDFLEDATNPPYSTVIVPDM